MDREGLRVVPEAAPDVEEESAQAAEPGALTGQRRVIMFGPGAGGERSARCVRGRSGCTSRVRSLRPAEPSCSRPLSAGWSCGSPAQPRNWAWCWPRAAYRRCCSARGAGRSPTGSTCAGCLSAPRRPMVVLAGVLWALAAAGKASVAAIVVISVAGGVIRRDNRRRVDPRRPCPGVPDHARPRLGQEARVIHEV